MKNICFLFILASMFSCNKEVTSTPLYEKIKIPENEILKQFKHSSTHNYIVMEELVKDEKTAISIAEPLLFNVYGKENIVKQRPYKIGKVQNYWIIYGSHLKPQIGGVFEIIINSKNGNIEKYNHGE